jgi:hypothetical protein
VTPAPECLLLVGDVDDHCDLPSRRLTRQGYRVVTACALVARVHRTDADEQGRAGSQAVTRQ